MWVSEGVDQGLLDGALDAYGIVPRDLVGLRGIPLAPFLHADFAHLSANTLPLFILGSLIGFKGVVRLAQVSVSVILLGGFALWVVGRDGVHLGASMVVFGYFGYLVAAAFFERNARSIWLAWIATLLYGGIIWGALPSNSAVSWEGHLCGLIAGVVTARRLAEPPAPRRPRSPHPPRPPRSPGPPQPPRRTGRSWY